jgi:hypothetical protein
VFDSVREVLVSGYIYIYIYIYIYMACIKNVGGCLGDDDRETTTTLFSLVQRCCGFENRGTIIFVFDMDVSADSL